MSKIKLLSLLLLFGLVIVWITLAVSREDGKLRTPIHNTETENWNIYKNEKYGFLLKYPKDWEVLRSDNKRLQIIYQQNTITVSILVFEEATFQDWMNERPYALIKFQDRDALRWSVQGVPTPTHSERGKFYGTEHFIIPAKSEDWAVVSDMNIDDTRLCSNCVRIFEQLAYSIIFGGVK